MSITDFLLSTLPFIIIGLCIAIICVNYKKESYIYEGIGIGMLFGAMLGAAFFQNQLALSLSLGILIGEAIGSSIKKE